MKKIQHKIHYKICFISIFLFPVFTNMISAEELQVINATEIPIQLRIKTIYGPNSHFTDHSITINPKTKTTIPVIENFPKEVIWTTGNTTYRTPEFYQPSKIKIIDDGSSFKIKEEIDKKIKKHPKQAAIKTKAERQDPAYKKEIEIVHSPTTQKAQKTKCPALKLAIGHISGILQVLGFYKNKRPEVLKSFFRSGTGDPILCMAQNNLEKNKFVIGKQNGKIYALDLLEEEKNKIRIIETEDEEEKNNPIYAIDNNKLENGIFASGSESGNITLWNLLKEADKEKVCKVRINILGVEAIAFCNQEDIMACVSAPNTIKLLEKSQDDNKKDNWQITKTIKIDRTVSIEQEERDKTRPKRKHPINAPEKYDDDVQEIILKRINAIKFSPTEKGILACAIENELVILDIFNQTDILVKSLQGHNGRILAIEFSPENPNIIITTSDDKTVKVWDISKNENCCIKTLNGHTGPVTSISIGKHGKKNIIATGSGKTVKLWNLEKEENDEIGTLNFESSVSCLSFLE